MTDASKRVKFNNPPLVEVVCGVMFETNPVMNVAQLGGFAHLMRDEFPETRDLAPLSPVYERPPGPHPAEISIVDTPPIPRQWLLGNKSSQILQVQQDRFHYNWKRDPDVKYPNYENVIGPFLKYFSKFDQHGRSCGIIDILFKQYEMTYVNIIDLGRKNNDVFRDHAWHLCQRFLPSPESMAWRVSFVLPNSNGRLHANVQSVVSTGGEKKHAIKLELTARGYPTDDSMGMEGWFDLAHDWITRGFVDLTNLEIQKNEWERVQ